MISSRPIASPSGASGPPAAIQASFSCGRAQDLESPPRQKVRHPLSPPSVHVSPRYIEDGLAETAVPNMVTAVLADYRGFDTFGEVTVVFTAAVAVMLILRVREKE